MRIVNISPHIGGGVGVVLADYVRRSAELGVQNSLFCLDWCVQSSSDMSLDVEITQGAFWEARKSLLTALSNCDLILIHYWNHPLLTVFLAEVDLRIHKIVFWCHISGLAEPHIIPNYISDIGDKIVFSSRVSLGVPNYEHLNLGSSGNLSVVATVRDLDTFFKLGYRRVLSKVPKSLLYVGTVSKTKMHRDSARIFAELSKRGFLIRVVGGPDHEELATEVAHLGGHIEVSGPVRDVTEFFEVSNVFIYPLRKNHYGTGEQVVIEALASGLPVVAFNNFSESEILNQFEGMKLVGSLNEFLESVFHLTESAEMLFQLAKNTYQKAWSVFKPGNMANRMVDVLLNVAMSKMRLKKSHYSGELKLNLLDLYARASFFDEEIYKNTHMSPYDKVEVILSIIEAQLEHESEISRWQTNSKSTPTHYLEYFPDDTYLLHLKNSIDNREFRSRL